MEFDLLATLANVFAKNGPAAPAVAQTYSPNDFSIRFFLQLAIILLACRIVGWFGRKFLAQPQVVGEMIAGVLLGPSLFGMLAPEVQAAIFPKEMRNVLYTGAQLGVGLYMFLVGTTLQLDHFATKARSAIGVSVAGIAAPFFIAFLITPLLLTVPGLFADGISTANATLFMGACIALTAFPMLARIINERGLANTSLGTLSLTAGAFDDAVSWCVLALVLAAFGAGPGVAVLAIGGGVLYAAFIMLFGRRLLAPLGRIVEREGHMSTTILGITMALFCLSAFVMDAVGIHAIFGGFILGAVMPRGLFAQELKKKVEPLAVVLLLPMFFTYSGLNTRLDMIDTMQLFLIALGIGALMNSRGLMELIIINIGLQKGIIGPALFSMLVLMAVVTTMMATPLFEAVYGRKARESGELEALPRKAADSAA